MGEILHSKDTVTMDSKHGVELLPENSSNPLGCLLQTSQVSSLMCPPVVPHQEPCIPPSDKSPIRHVPNLQNVSVGLPILKLHRLQAKDFRRFKDIAKVGISRECAKHLRHQLQRFRRNARRRNIRKLYKSQNNAKLCFKRENIFSEDFVKGDRGDTFRLSDSQKTSVIKRSRPTTNGSLTESDGGKAVPVKKARLQLPYKSWPRYDLHSSACMGDSRVLPLNPPLPPLVPLRHQGTAAHPSLMAMPWLSPSSALLNRAPYAAHPAISSSLMSPISPALAAPMGKYPVGPPMMPMRTMPSPVFPAPQSVVSTPSAGHSHANLYHTGVVAKPEKVFSATPQTAQSEKPQVPSHTAESHRAFVQAYPHLVAKNSDSPTQPSVAPLSSILTPQRKTSDSSWVPRLEKLSTPTSVLSKPPPLIRLPPLKDVVGTQNAKNLNTPLSSHVPHSSSSVHEQSVKEKAKFNQVEKSTHFNTTFHAQPASGPYHVSPAVMDVVGSSNFSTANSSSSKDVSLAVPNALAKAAASSVGLTGSPMVFIPASVAFDSFSNKVSPPASQTTTKSSQVKPNLNASLSASSLTPNVSTQYYWILSPQISTQSTTVTELSAVEPSHESSRKLSSSRTAAQLTPPTLAVSFSKPPDTGIMAPTPVSSSSCLASLLKAGVPLVPVSSATQSSLPSVIPNPYLSSTPVTTSICIPAPIMSTPYITDNTKKVSKHSSSTKYKYSRPGPKCSKKRPLPPNPERESTDLHTFKSAPDSPPVKSGTPGSDSKQHKSVFSITTTSASPSSCSPGTSTTSRKIDNIIKAVLDESTAVRLIMESVSGDSGSSSKTVESTPSKTSKNKCIKKRQYLDGTSKSPVKKRSLSKLKPDGQSKLKKKNSSCGLEIPKDNWGEEKTRTYKKSAKHVKFLDKDWSARALTVTQRSVITNTNIWKDEHAEAPSTTELVKSPSEEAATELSITSAKAEYVPVISRVRQTGLFTPPFPSDSATAEGTSLDGGQEKAHEDLGKKLKPKKKPISGSFLGSNGSLNKKFTLIPKTSKNKITTLKLVKRQIKNCVSGKALHGKKYKLKAVESLTNEDRPVSIFKKVRVHIGPAGVRSTIIHKAESSHEKVNGSSTSAHLEAPHTKTYADSLYAPKEILQGNCSGSMALSRLSAELSRIPAKPRKRKISRLPYARVFLDSSLTPLQHKQIISTVCVKTASVTLERLTHRHIKKDFLKKNRINVWSGILLRRKLRNFDIKRYLLLRGKNCIPMTPQISGPSSKDLPKDHKRVPKIGPEGSKSAAVHQMLLEASTGIDPDSSPLSDVPPEPLPAPCPRKHKPRKGPPPHVVLMNELRDSLWNTYSDKGTQRASDLSSHGIISANKKQLLRFRNERLSRGQIKYLTWLGLNLAKRASKNSYLDSLEGSHIMMDLGMFGLKGSARPPPSWSLVLDSQGSRIDTDAAVRPKVSQSQTTLEDGIAQDHLPGAKLMQPPPAHTTALTVPHMYSTNTLPPGHVYATTFLAPGQLQTGQGQLHVLAPIPGVQDGSGSLSSAQVHTQAVVNQGRMYGQTAIPPAHVPISTGIPPTAVVQTSSPMGTRILSVDHTGRVRETLSQGIPTAYSRYPSAPRPDGWNTSRSSGRSSPPPPLTFMGGGALSSNLKASRVMPPPLSFMGAASETSTRPVMQLSYSQASPRSLHAGNWARALDLSQQGSASQNYSVINHTRQVTDKRPPNLSYAAQGHIVVEQQQQQQQQRQQHQQQQQQRQQQPVITYNNKSQSGLEQQPSRAGNAVQAHTVPNQHPYNITHTVQAQRPPGFPQCSQEQRILNHRQNSLLEEVHRKITANQKQPDLLQAEQGSPTLSKQPSSLPQNEQMHSVLKKQVPSWPHISNSQVEISQQPSSVLSATQRCAALNQLPPGILHSSQVQVKVIMEHRPPSLPRSVTGSTAPSLQSPVTSRPETSDSKSSSSPAVAVIHQLPSMSQVEEGPSTLNPQPSYLQNSTQRYAVLSHQPQGQVIMEQRPPSLPQSVQGSPASSLQTPVSSRNASPDSTRNQSPAVSDFGSSAEEPEPHHHHEPRIPEVMAVVEALVLQLIDIGLPTSLNNVIQTVKQLFQARGTHKPFCCKSEAEKWYQDFRRAHVHRFPNTNEDRTLRLPTDHETRQWLTKLKIDMIKFHGVTPRRVFYMQELNFFLDKQTREIKYHRMFPGKVNCSNEKDTVTVLFILCANGQIGPGMIIFPRMVIPEKLLTSLRNTEGGKEWVLGSSMNGWLYSDCISEFLSDVFVPWLNKRHVHFPVALFTSEYVSNIPLSRMSESFMAQGIQLIPVPRMMSPILSPGEWIVADYFRTSWGRALSEWSVRNNSKPLLEENFAPFIIGCLTAQSTPAKVHSKFRKLGIYPFDPQAMFQCLRSHSRHH